ncbi:nucleoside phosphorylase domain-containing protein [Aspergillus cavernicola]|uniref:Nucleoside phosphorylase domain-containing protein n=1 Tax=Aspergillus cavernicola TaxID=176166 RepID=A0ABR4HC50_9EURO
MREDRHPYTAKAVMEGLTDPINLNMVLYDDLEDQLEPYTGQLRLRDRIAVLYGFLEKIIDHQTEIAGRDGEGLSLAPRRDLEAWDFKDIATIEDPLTPKAPTLFGCAFGDIFQPTPDAGLCAYWSTLPKNKYCLSATTDDLIKIIDRFGDPRLKPLRLTGSLAWHVPKVAPGKECRCIGEDGNHINLAQVILPSRMQVEIPPIGPPPFARNGAVVFGYNTDLGWIWDDTGHPRRSEQLPTEDSDSEVDDSGIGTSIGSLTHENYEIGIVCALPKELMAVRILFDDPHQDLPLDQHDANFYALGRMGIYNVVAACLPYLQYGTTSAATVASNMLRSFPAIKWWFVVGIGGGVPSTENDIRLGDVVVGTGVMEYDLGKTVQGAPASKRTGSLHHPAAVLMRVITRLTSDHGVSDLAVAEYINKIAHARPEYKYPGDGSDRLFLSSYVHEAGQPTCKDCNGPRVERILRSSRPKVHYGLIASGNQVIKDAMFRDRLSKIDPVLCFEMEAAGVVKTGQCLVIRGICDYSDSHKNDLAGVRGGHSCGLCEILPFASTQVLATLFPFVEKEHGQRGVIRVEVSDIEGLRRPQACLM